MAYRKVDPEFKLGIIKALWADSNYSQLSKKYDIPRATIYHWERTAKDAIIHAFAQKTPGKRTINLEEENQKLREQLLAMYHVKHKTAQDTSLPEPSPLLCHQCGSRHIKKNGTVLTKRDGLRQRYHCLECSVSIYLEIKKSFF